MEKENNTEQLKPLLTVVEGGEPWFFRLVWWGVYVLIALAAAGIVPFVVAHLEELPIAFWLGFLIQLFTVVMFIRNTVRCLRGIDAFVVDHPIACRGDESRLEVRGTFSRATVSDQNTRGLKRFLGWIIVSIRLNGRNRQLWFAPWFHNRSEVLRLLTR